MPKAKLLSKEEAASRILNMEAPRTNLNSSQHHELVNDISKILNAGNNLDNHIKTPYEQEKLNIDEALFGTKDEQTDKEFFNQIKVEDKPIYKCATARFDGSTDIIRYQYVKTNENGSYFYAANHEVVAYLPIGIPWIKR